MKKQSKKTVNKQAKKVSRKNNKLRKRVVLAKAQISEMLKMHKSGQSIAAITSKFKITSPVIYYHLNKKNAKK